MRKKVLILYPNLPLMMVPALSVAIFSAICKQEDVEVKVFETTNYSNDYNNRHIRMTEIGAARTNSEDELKDIYFIQPKSKIIPDLTNLMETYKPDLVLMSVQEDVWYDSLDLLKVVDEYNIPHILGGVFPTSVPDLVMNNPLVKNICRQEGENLVRDAIKAIKEDRDITSIDGLIWKDNTGKIHKNKPQQLCDITKVVPDFSAFPINRWKRPMGGKIFERAVSMETYRGCPYNCTYCNSPNTRNVASKELKIGNFMRRKPVDVIESELLHYKELMNPDLIMFQDDSFLARPKKEIFEFCEMWSKYKIPFWFNTRIENCTPDVLLALKNAGVYRMTFGLESGNEKYRMKMLQRPVTNESYRKHFEYINDSNIPYSLNVIIGMPLETRDMVLETASLIYDTHGGHDGLTISMFQPYNGTPLREIAVKNGFIDKDYITSDGGLLDQYALKMPAPYVSPIEVKRLAKTFSLYSFFHKSRWAEIFEAETNDELFNILLKEYQSIFFEDIQAGGKDKIGKYCAKHDPSSTYEFTAVL